MKNIEERNIFGENEHFIEDINYEKIKDFLSRLKNQININKLFLQIRHKIQNSDIIPNILNSEILENNRLIYILLDLYLESNNENRKDKIIIDLLNILIGKIMIKREYIYYICHKIRIWNDKEKINENIMIKIIETFRFFFNRENINDINLTRSSSDFEIIKNYKKKVEFDYFYFYKLKDGLKCDNITNFSLNNSFIYFIFKRESESDFSFIQIEINNLLNIDISVINNILTIKVNDKVISMKKNIEIQKSNFFYVLKINLLISSKNINKISEKNFKIQLFTENIKNKITEQNIKKEKKKYSFNITLLKNFTGIIKSIFISKTEINYEDTLFSIKNHLNYYLILSPLSYKKDNIIDPVNNYKFKIKDTFFNNIVNKQSYLTFNEKIEILLPLFEIVSINEFPISAQNLFLLFINMTNNKKRKSKKSLPKEYDNYFFIIQKFIKYSQINWANKETLKYNSFLSLYLMKNIYDDESKDILDSIIDKIEDNININEIKMWLYYGGKGDFIRLKYFIFPRFTNKFLNNLNDFIDIFFLFSRNQNIFLFIFILVLLSNIQCSKYYDFIRENHYFYLLYFYFKNGKFELLYINDKENTLKNNIIVSLREIIRLIYSNINDLINIEPTIRNEILSDFISLIDENEINAKRKSSFDILKYIKEEKEKGKISFIDYSKNEPLSIFVPKEIMMKDKILDEYKEHLKFWNCYKKIKKKLFLWNGPYSVNDIFFNKNNTKEIKYKLSNHLTIEITLPLLVPIADINTYLPFFSKFEKEKIFKCPLKDIYSINLYPFNSFLKKPNEQDLFSFGNYSYQEKNDLEFNICFIKHMYHDKSILEIKENKKEIHIYSLPNYIMVGGSNYDIEQKKCYGSFLNSKSKILRYKCIDINKIDFYLERTYLFQKNSLEIFTINKSYFFQFDSENKKKIFIEKIKKLNPKINVLDKKKVIDEWKRGNMSNLEFIMKVNLLANRSLKDINQYPVFPWLTLNNEIEKKENEPKGNNQITLNLRPLDTPIGFLSYTEKGINRKLKYLKVFKMEIENLNENNNCLYKFKEINKINDIPQYDNSLTLLYDNSTIPLNEIPSVFKNHFLNSTNVTHYLVRIFPFTNISIEIKGKQFNIPEKIFINFEKTFHNSSYLNNDISEIIPQFFYLPEIFININNLNFGKLNKNKLNDPNSTISLQYKLKMNEEVNDCLIPFFANNDPYLFIINYRTILENKEIHIEDWINLIFGEFSKGKKAQDKGNIYMAYCYDGVIEKRINPKNKILYYRLNEFGRNPFQIFDRLYPKNKLIINYPYTINFGIEDYTFQSMINIHCESTLNLLTLNLIFIEQNSKIISLYKVCLDLNGEITNDIKTFQSVNFSMFKNKVIKTMNSNLKIIITDSFLLNLIISKENLISIYNKTNRIQNIPNTNIITILIISQNEEYLFLGTKSGRIIIYLIKDTINIYKKFTAHDKQVNYINDNKILNMFISCSDDCFINVYLLPDVELVRVLKINNNIIPDYAFLSSSPLPSIVIYSNIQEKFLCFSLNGKFFHEKDRKDEDLFNSKKKNNTIKKRFKFPSTERLIDFNDYLIYFEGERIIFRKFPLMEFSFHIKNSLREQQPRIFNNFGI